MPLVSQLPSEITHIIFNFLSIKDKYQCQTVCQSWFLLSRQLCYRQVEVHDSNILSLLRSFDKQQFMSFLYIKSLKIESHQFLDCQRLLERDEFCRLIQYCTNLEKLMIAPGSIYWDYLEYFPQINFKQISYPEVPSRVPSKTSSYYASLYKYKKTLTCLDIHNASDPWIRENFDCLVNYLQNFPQLKHLTINGGGKISMVYLNSILKICDRLKTLVFDLDHPLIAYGDTAIAQYPTLESLEIYLPDFSISSLEYIRCAFANLKNFNLRLFHGHSHKWTDKQTVYVRTHLMPYLQTLSTYSVKFDMESRCENIEDLVLSQISASDILLELNFSESKYERTQLDLIRSSQSIVRCTKTFDPNLSMDGQELYFERLGGTVTRLKIKSDIGYMISPEKILCRFPLLSSLTIETPCRDFQINPSTYRHSELTELIFKQARVNIETVQILSSLGNIKRISFIGSTVILNSEDSDVSKDIFKKMHSWFGFINGELNMSNVSLHIKYPKATIVSKYEKIKLRINK